MYKRLHELTENELSAKNKRPPAKLENNTNYPSSITKCDRISTNQKA